jgi:ATP-dependent DNA helicase RecQ
LIVPPDPVLILRRHLGYDGFRPGQEELVRAVLAGRDALGILPTGGGKSVCYQVPALALGDLTLVVTPLVSLMEDQVGRARAAGLRAAHLSATQDAAERSATLQRAASGELSVLFVAPERLELEAFRRALARMPVRLLAVDEAHCISEWGHDFRPSYRRIGRLGGVLRCPTLALTATATPSVRDDIVGSLGLTRPLVVVKSFDRPNLAWCVLRGRSPRERVATVHRLLRRRAGCAIVYAPTRRTVERVRDDLARYGIATEAYHAGLPGAERSRVQGAFMDGGCRVVVATNAFGMGIDKPNVRTVVHVQLPGTLEAYYQEAGRAGRDGLAASCVAFHARTDGRLSRLFVDRTHPPPKELRRTHSRLLVASDRQGVLRLDGPGLDWAARLVEEWSEDAGAGTLAALERAGAVRAIAPPGAAVPVLGVRRHLDTAVGVRLRRRALAKIAAVERYARGKGCRRRALLRYFGEIAPPRCGSCDRCGADPTRASSGPPRLKHESIPDARASRAS